MSKIALVLEGGGLRGVFTAGVIDCFIENNIDFDYVCGVSAGSCNTFSYVSKSKGYFKRCILNGDKNDSFYGVKQMRESHKFVNLDKVFYEYTEKYGYNIEGFKNTKIDWEFVVSNIETGKAEYMHSDDYDSALKMGVASCSLPILTTPVEIDNNLYLDGGMTDSVPVQRALDKGYDKVVVVCTRKKGSYSKVKSYEKPVYNRLYKEYPNFLKAVSERTELYRNQIELCESLEKQGKVILIRPTLHEVKRLESDLDELSLAYYHGYTKAQEYIEQIKNW